LADPRLTTGTTSGRFADGPVPLQRVAEAHPESLAPQGAHAVAPAPAESYVRLMVHSEGGKLTVVDAHEVAGPVDMPVALPHGHVYGVSIDDKRIALGSIPDAGVSRSFANRDVPGKEGKPGEVGCDSRDRRS